MSYWLSRQHATDKTVLVRLIELIHTLLLKMLFED